MLYGVGVSLSFRIYVSKRIGMGGVDMETDLGGSGMIAVDG
jgi:hypothetical protein